MIPVDYIVRIYRYQKDNPRKLVGTVEEVGAEGKKAFISFDELWKILNSPTGSDALAPLLGEARNEN